MSLLHSNAPRPSRPEPPREKGQAGHAQPIFLLAVATRAVRISKGLGRNKGKQERHRSYVGQCKEAVLYYSEEWWENSDNVRPSVFRCGKDLCNILSKETRQEGCRELARASGCYWVALANDTLLFLEGCWYLTASALKAAAHSINTLC